MMAASSTWICVSCHLGLTGLANLHYIITCETLVCLLFPKLTWALSSNLRHSWSSHAVTLHGSLCCAMMDLQATAMCPCAMTYHCTLVTDDFVCMAHGISESWFNPAANFQFTASSKCFNRNGEFNTDLFVKLMLQNEADILIWLL